MLDMITLNQDQDKMLAAVLDLLDACDAYTALCSKVYNTPRESEDWEQLWDEKGKAFDARTQKRKEFYAMIRENPDLAGDLIERLAKKLR